MISANFFHQVSERISKAKAWDPASGDKPFGGVNLIITGDMGQMPLVNTASLFSHKLVKQINMNMAQTPLGQELLNGAFLWCQLNKVIELRQNLRAKGDKQFINLLSRIRSGNAWNGVDKLTMVQTGTGKIYVSDYQVLLGRCLQTLTRDKYEIAHKFKDVPIVVGEKTLRDSLNNKIVQNFAKKPIKRCIGITLMIDITELHLPVPSKREC